MDLRQSTPFSKWEAISVTHPLLYRFQMRYIQLPSYQRAVVLHHYCLTHCLL
jgi:hypothetical protein